MPPNSLKKVKEAEQGISARSICPQTWPTAQGLERVNVTDMLKSPLRAGPLHCPARIKSPGEDGIELVGEMVDRTGEDGDGVEVGGRVEVGGGVPVEREQPVKKKAAVMVGLNTAGMKPFGLK